MAKMFYTLDEAKAALGKIRRRDPPVRPRGRLREFRDGPRLMFKADQVEQLKSEVAGGGRRRSERRSQPRHRRSRRLRLRRPDRAGRHHRRQRHQHHPQRRRRRSRRLGARFRHGDSARDRVRGSGQAWVRIGLRRRIGYRQLRRRRCHPHRTPARAPAPA